MRVRRRTKAHKGAALIIRTPLLQVKLAHRLALTAQALAQSSFVIAESPPLVARYSG